MRGLLKKIFEKDGFAPKLVKAMNEKKNGFADLYLHFKRLIDMPYDPQNDYPDRVLKYGSNMQRILLVDTSVKTQRKYRVIESLYKKPEDNEIIMFLFNHWGVKYKLLQPFTTDFEFSRSIEGLKDAIKEAQRLCWEKRGFVIIQGQSTRYTLFAFEWHCSI
jgi:hypothetical protein